MLSQIQELSVDVAPQAIVGLPVAKVVGKRARLSKGYDDLDSYEGASFKLDNSLEISVRHYRGYPKDTATIYIDSRVSDVEYITVLIRKILKELNIPISALQWERQKDPHL